MAVAVQTASVSEVLDRALAGERIDDDDAAVLLSSRDLVAIGRAAHELRNRKSPPGVVTFVVDRNLNYSNVCYTDCSFCAFYRRPGDTREGYVLPRAVIFKKIEETLALDGTALLMQGGHNPDLGIDWYEDLFREIKARYPIHLHALSPSEVQHIARRSRLSTSETLSRLRDAGLDSLPGGGAEILVDRVRKIISPIKTTSDEWLAIMRAAHRLGMSTTATMMWGHVETLEERIEHFRRIRDLQDEMHGFRAFISWTYQPDNTRLAKDVHWHPTSFDYLLMQAVSRIYLDNVDHIQSSWVTQGTKIGQVALLFGADDMGSIMIEENVVSAAGTTYRATTEDFVHLIRNAGFRPQQRDTLYRTVQDYASCGEGPVSRCCSASPEAVWEWVVDPHRHIQMLPGLMRNAQVLEDGDMQAELVTAGVSELMVVRVTATDPPRRLEGERVDGRTPGRRGVRAGARRRRPRVTIRERGRRPAADGRPGPEAGDHAGARASSSQTSTG